MMYAWRNKSIHHQTWELDPQLYGNWTLNCMETGPSIAWELDPQLHRNWTLNCMGTGPSIAWELDLQLHGNWTLNCMGTGPSIVCGQKWEPNNQLPLGLIVAGEVKQNGCAISGLKYRQTLHTHSTNTFTWVSYTPRICTSIVGRHTTMYQNDPVT